MKRTLLLILVFGVPSWLLAKAPESIANRVYRQTSFFIREREQMTIVFGPDGRFTFLKYATGSVLDFNRPPAVYLRAPRPDGTYSYRRTSETAAVVELANDDGTRQTLELNFTIPNGGNNINGTFSFSDIPSASAVPATNISMRGRVTDGRALITGFIVPGNPSAASTDFIPTAEALRAQREVLIRVVGPSLAQFGVSDTWADPDFGLYRGNAPAPVHEARYSDWSALPTSVLGARAGEAGFRKIFNHVGAFPLSSGSTDAAGVFRLGPGAYTIVARAPVGDPGGEVLIEVYFLP